MLGGLRLCISVNLQGCLFCSGNAEEQKRLGYELTPLQEEAYWCVPAAQHNQRG